MKLLGASMVDLEVWPLFRYIIWWERHSCFALVTDLQESSEYKCSYVHVDCNQISGAVMEFSDSSNPHLQWHWSLCVSHTLSNIVLPRVWRRTDSAHEILKLLLQWATKSYALRALLEIYWFEVFNSLLLLNNWKFRTSILALFPTTLFWKFVHYVMLCFLGSIL